MWVFWYEGRRRRRRKVVVKKNKGKVDIWRGLAELRVVATKCLC